MNEDLRRQIENALGLALAAAEGDQLAVRVFRSADNRVQTKRLLAQLSAGCSGEGSTPAPDGNAGRGEHATHLIVLSGDQEARSTLGELRRWLKGAQRITICDPYLLKPPQSSFFASEAAYVDLLLGLLPSKAEYIDVLCDGFKQTIKRDFSERAKHGRSQVRVFSTNEIHDRFIVRDDDVKLIGTSFGGFGNKIFAVVDLSAEDREVVLQEVSAIRDRAVRRRIRRNGQNAGSVFE